VLGESDTNTLCIIPVVAEEGIVLAKLKEAICLHPDVSALFPGLRPSGIRLRAQGEMELWLQDDNVRIMGGQAVHMCSGKGSSPGCDDATPVFYYASTMEGFYVMVPLGRSMLHHVCKELDFDQLNHEIRLCDGRYELCKRKRANLPPPPPISVVNNNNNMDVPFLLPPQEEFASKWQSEHDAQIILPDGKDFMFTVMGSSENARAAISCICGLFKLGDPDKYRLCYAFIQTPLEPVIIMPGCKYIMRELK